MVQYADDTLIVIKACNIQLPHLKSSVDTFVVSFDLKVNYQKSSMMPINVLDDDMQILSRALNCQVGSFRFIYLGVPLSITKSRMRISMSIIEKKNPQKVKCLFSIFKL